MKLSVKRILSLVTAFLLAVVMLTACGGADSAATGANEGSEKSAAASTPGTAAGTGESTAEASTAASAPAKLTKLSFGTSPWPTSMFAYLAKEKGIFEKHGLDVQLNTFASFSDSLQAFIGGNLDFITAASPDTIAPFSQGADFDVIMLTDKSMGSDGMVTKPEIKSISDLKGKTVATEFYSVDHMYLLSLLNEAGMSAKDVSLTNMTIADAGTAFIAGRVDAAVIWEPYLSKALKDGKGSLLYSSKDNPDLITDSITASRKIVDSSPEAVQAFVDSWYEAVDYWKSNQDESEAIMAKALEVSQEDFRAMMETLYIANAKDALEAFEPASGESSFVKVNQMIAQFLKDLDVIKTVPEIKDMINSEFLKNSSMLK